MANSLVDRHVFARSTFQYYLEANLGGKNLSFDANRAVFPDGAKTCILVDWSGKWRGLAPTAASTGRKLVLIHVQANRASANRGGYVQADTDLQDLLNLLFPDTANTYAIPLKNKSNAAVTGSYLSWTADYELAPMAGADGWTVTLTLTY